MHSTALPDRPPCAPPQDDHPLRISSSELLCGRRTLEIEHAGQRYILRLTRENKLILTK